MGIDIPRLAKRLLVVACVVFTVAWITTNVLGRLGDSGPDLVEHRTTSTSER